MRFLRILLGSTEMGTSMRNKFLPWREVIEGFFCIEYSLAFFSQLEEIYYGYAIMNAIAGIMKSLLSYTHFYTLYKLPIPPHPNQPSIPPRLCYASALRGSA